MKERRAANKTDPPAAGDPSYSIKLRGDVLVEGTEDGRVALSRNGATLLHVPANPLIDHLSRDWATEESVDRLAESVGNPCVLYYLCGKLFSLGLLQGRYSIDGNTLFSLIPSPEWHEWKEKAPLSSIRLSPRVCLRRSGERLILEMPLSRRRCAIEDGVCLNWLMEIIRKEAPLSAGNSLREVFYRALQLMGALEREPSGEPDIWEFSDLLFFHHSSIGFHDDPVGATFRLKGIVPPEPVFKASVGESVQLLEPDGCFAEMLKTPFADVLKKRRSGRVAGKNPPSLEGLGALLHQSARVLAVQESPVGTVPVSLRPSPSGGALHSLEIYPLIMRCACIAPGAWHYAPQGHRLDRVNADEGLLEAYLRDNPHYLQTGDEEPPHIRLVVTSRFLRNAWKYEKIAYRLVLQDLGCLYQTIGLTATALGFVSCIIGAVDARRLSDILRLDLALEPVIGEMTLSAP